MSKSIDKNLGGELFCLAQVSLWTRRGGRKSFQKNLECQNSKVRQNIREKFQQKGVFIWWQTGFMNFFKALQKMETFLNFDGLNQLRIHLLSTRIWFQIESELNWNRIGIKAELNRNWIGIKLELNLNLIGIKLEST